MLEKAKQFYYRWYNKVSEFWTDERYIFAILTFLPPPILVGLLICFTIKAIIAGFNFLRLYYAQLIFAAFAVCVEPTKSALNARRRRFESARTTRTNMKRPGRRMPHMLQGQKSSFHVRGS